MFMPVCNNVLQRTDPITFDIQSLTDYACIVLHQFFFI